MDVAALTIFLAPALKFLLDVGGDVTERARTSLGEAGWEQARALWGRLRGKVEKDPAALSVAERVAEQPEDAEARTALTFFLRQILRDDPELERALAADWESARGHVTAIASAERSVAIAGGSGNVVITGDAARADRGS